MTRAQKYWLDRLRSTGFVERGGWGRAQRNRPLRALVQQGLAVEGYGPAGSMLTVYGFLPVGDWWPETSTPQSETLSMVVTVLSS